nr:MAG TPA: hypothetical protein [Caudoviricetes sp.]
MYSPFVILNLAYVIILLLFKIFIIKNYKRGD